MKIWTKTNQEALPTPSRPTPHREMYLSPYSSELRVEIHLTEGSDLVEVHLEVMRDLVSQLLGGLLRLIGQLDSLEKDCNYIAWVAIS